MPTVVRLHFGTESNWLSDNKDEVERELDHLRNAFVYDTYEMFEMLPTTSITRTRLDDIQSLNKPN